MPAIIIYKPVSEHARKTEAYARRLGELRIDTQLLDADTHEGVAAAELYDLTSRPAMVLTRGDGTMIERWQGEMPLAEDVSYLVRA